MQHLRPVAIAFVVAAGLVVSGCSKKTDTAGSDTPRGKRPAGSPPPLAFPPDGREATYVGSFEDSPGWSVRWTLSIRPDSLFFLRIEHLGHGDVPASHSHDDVGTWMAATDGGPIRFVTSRSEMARELSTSARVKPRDLGDSESPEERAERAERSRPVVRDLPRPSSREAAGVRSHADPVIVGTGTADGNPESFELTRGHPDTLRSSESAETTDVPKFLVRSLDARAIEPSIRQSGYLYLVKDRLMFRDPQLERIWPIAAEGNVAEAQRVYAERSTRFVPIPVVITGRIVPRVLKDGDPPQPAILIETIRWIEAPTETIPYLGGG